MGDLLCRLTYFRYTGAISERNMDRRLRVCNDEISVAPLGALVVGWRRNSGIRCQLVSGIGSVASPSGKYQLQIFINARLYLGGKVLNLMDARFFKCTSGADTVPF